MTEKVKKIFFILFLLSPVMVLAQQKDFGSWWSIGSSYDLSKKTGIEMEASLRTDNNSTHVKTVLFEGGISRELSNLFSISLNYRYSHNDNDETNYVDKHRLYSDLKFKFPVNRFDLSSRIRYQREYQVNVDSKKDKVPEDYLRFKVGATYDWPSSPYNPFLSTDLYYPLDNSVNALFEKKRLQAGIKYKMKKKRSLQVGVLYQRDIYPKLSEYYGVVFAYNFSL